MDQTPAPLRPIGNGGSAWWWPMVITPPGLALGCGLGVLLANALVGRSSVALACIGAVLGATAGALQTLVLRLPGQQLRTSLSVWMVVSSLVGAVSTFWFPWFLGGGTGATPTSAAGLTSLESLFAGAGYGACVGLVLALFQWLLIRRQVERAWRWSLAGAVGWMLGWAPLGMVLSATQG